MTVNKYVELTAGDIFIQTQTSDLLTKGAICFWDSIKRGNTVNATFWYYINHPLGSIPKRSNSFLPSVFSQFARLMPASIAALSNCVFSSGEIRILNCGACPSPLGLLSRLIIDRWSPIKLISLLIGGHLIMVKLMKTIPHNARTLMGHLTTRDNLRIEAIMLNHNQNQNKFTFRSLPVKHVDYSVLSCSLSADSYIEKKPTKYLHNSLLCREPQFRQFRGLAMHDSISLNHIPQKSVCCIPIDKDFSGRVLLTIRNGKVICHESLAENVYVLTLIAFMEMVEKCEKQIAESEGTGYESNH